MLVTGAFGDLLDKSIRKIYFEAYDRYPLQYTTVLNVQNAESAVLKESSITGLGMAKDMNESEEIPEGTAYQGYDVTYNVNKIGDAIKVTKENLEDDEFGKIKMLPVKLADSVHRKMEYEAAKIWNTGHETTNFTGGDDVALFSESHPREDGGAVQSNTGSTALAQSTINSTRVNMSKILDGQGQKLMIKPDLLIIPPDLEQTARELLNSELKPDTANNNTNVFKGILDVFVYNWLDDTNDYFFMDRSQSQLKLLWRRKPMITRDDSISTEVARWYITGRYALGFSDWRSVYGYSVS